MNHEFFLNQCLEIAKQGVSKGNHPFGALLVFNNEVVVTAENEVNTRSDFTAHAELLLLQRAQKILKPEQLASATLYTSTEPCPMCTGALFWCGVKEVVYGYGSKDLTILTGHGFLIDDLS